MDDIKKIVFEGELSVKNKKYFIKQLKIIIFLCWLISSWIVAIPFILLTIFNDKIFIYFSLLLLLFPFIFLIIKNKHLEDMLPKKVIIYKDLMISFVKNAKYEEVFDNISKVVDYGDCYKIYFKLFYKNQSFICQKDLIKEGTLDEFENLFSNELIKK